MLFDTGASKGIFGDATLLSDVISVPRVTFHGISGSDLPVNASRAGQFGDFGQVMVDGNASANVLSMSELKSRGFSFSYDNDKDSFLATSPTGGIHRFSPYKGLYALVRDRPRIRPMEGGGTKSK